MFGVGAVAANGLGNLLVDDDIDLHTGFSSPLQDLIESPLLVEVGWSSQEQLRAQPPVGDVDGLLCLLQSDGDGIEIVPTVDVPFDLVAISFRGERSKAVALGNAGPLLVGDLLVLFIMTMVGVDEVAKLADFVFQVDGANFGVVEVCACDDESSRSARVPQPPLAGRGLGEVRGEAGRRGGDVDALLFRRSRRPANIRPSSLASSGAMTATDILGKRIKVEVPLR